MRELMRNKMHPVTPNSLFRYIGFFLSLLTGLIVIYRAFGFHRSTPNVPTDEFFADSSGLNLASNSDPIIITPIPSQTIGRQQKFYFEIGIGSTFNDPHHYNLSVSTDIQYPPAALSWCHSNVGSLEGSISLGEASINHLVVSGAYAYLTGSAGLKIIDITEPDNLYMKGGYDTQRGYSVLAYQDNMIYLASTSSNFNPGIQIIDVHDHSSPTLIGSYPFGINPNDIFAIEDRLYLVYHSQNRNNSCAETVCCLLEIVDVSDPENPFLLGSYITNNYQDIFIIDSYAYIISAIYNVLEIVDLNNPKKLMPLVSYTTKYPCYHVIVKDDIAYLLCSGTTENNRVLGIEIVKVTPYVSPQWIGEYYNSIAGSPLYTRFYVHANYAYLTFSVLENKHEYSSFEIIDVANSKSPSLMSSREISHTTALAASGNHVFLSNGAVLQALSPSGPSLAFAGTPGPQDKGEAKVTVTADNGHGGAVTTSFNILVTSEPPVVNQAIPDFSLTPQRSFHHAIAEDTFISTYRDKLSYSVQYENAHNDFFMANFLWDPSWLNFDATHKTFSGIPTAWDTDGIIVMLTAHDEAKQTATIMFKVNVLGISPIEKGLIAVGIVGIGSAVLTLTYYNRFYLYTQFNRIKDRYRQTPVYALAHIPWGEIEKNQKLDLGTFDQFWQAKWHTTDIIINEQPPLSTLQFDLLLQTAETISRLRHPNIIIIYGVTINTERPQRQVCLVMENVDKNSLFNFLHHEETEISMTTKIRLAIEIAGGLHYLHSQMKPILHRGLNSHQILLKVENEQIHPKLLISNISTLQNADEENLSHETAWMAPELLTTHSVPNLAADIYAFGILLKEIITPQIPFDSASPPQLIVKDCPDDLTAIIKGCCETSPHNRMKLDTAIKKLKKYAASLNSDRKYRSTYNLAPRSQYFKSASAKEEPDESELTLLLDTSSVSLSPDNLV